MHAMTHLLHSPGALPRGASSWALTALLVLTLHAPAQQPPAPAPSAPPPAAAPALERTRAQLTASRAREAALREELVGLDRETDAKVEELVNMLKGVKDSTASNTEVQNTKKQAIDGLKRWVQLYAQERGRRLGQIQGPGSAAARTDLREEVAAIDAEINQRVDQIVQLAASMSTSEELKRYDSYATYNGAVTRERDEYRASHRQASRADQVQEGVEGDLEKAIANLEREIILVPQRLPRDRQEPELARLRGVLKERREDLRKLSSAAPGGARAVGDREANQIDRELRFAGEDIRALWSQLQAKASALSVERERRRQLEARIGMLEKEALPP